MASDKILYAEIAEKDLFADMRKSAETTLEAINKLEAGLKSIAGGLKKSVTGNPLQSAGDMGKMAEDSKKVADLEKTLTVVYTQQAEAKKQLAIITDQEVKARIRYNNAAKEQQAILKQEVALEKAAAGSIDELRAKLALVTKEWQKLSQQERDNTEAGRAVVKQKADLTAELQKLEGATNDHRRMVGGYSKAVSVLEGALREVNQKISQNTTGLNQNDEASKRLIKEQQLLAALLSKQQTGFAAATQELRNNRAALDALAAQGMENTQVYKDLLAETAKLKDSVGDLQAKIKNMASDTRTIDGLVGTAQTLAGAFGIAQGAAALFGDENEELQKTFVKLQAIMTIMNGLQAIQNALQKESSMMLFLTNVRARALAVGQQILAFATAGATTATKALRTALLGSGLGAILVLLPMVAEAMGLFGDETDDATSSNKKFNQTLEDQKKLLDDVLERQAKMRNAQQGGINDLRRQVEIAKAKGQDVYALEQKILTQELINLRTIQKAYISQGIAGEVLTEVNQKILDKENERRAAQIEHEIKLADAKVKGEKKVKEVKKVEGPDMEAAERKNAERRAMLIEGETKRTLALTRLRHEEELNQAVKNGEDIVLLARVQDAEIAAINEAAAKRDLESTQDEIEATAALWTAEDERRAAAAAAARQKRLDDEIAAIKIVTRAISQGLEERQRIQDEAMRKEVDKRDQAVKDQAARAAQGLENTLAFEQAERDKAEAKRLRAEKKAQQEREAIQLAETFIDLFRTYAKDDKVKNPAAKALVETLIAKGISKAIAGAFAEGVEGLDGAGTETSDSNLALLSKGESVITAKGTKENPGLATAMNTGSVDDYFRDYYLPQFAPLEDVPMEQQISKALVSVLSEKLDALIDKPVAQTSLRGLGEWTEEIEQRGNRKIVNHIRLQRRPRV